MRTSNQRRFQRGRNPNNNNRNNGRQNNRNTSFESNGPNMRVRGTAQQLAEKYQQHARDAGANGDLVLRENYLQHAEYYYRMFEPMDQQNNGAESQNDEDDMNNGDAQQGNDGQFNDGYDNNGYENNGRGNYGNSRQENGGQPRQRRRRWEMNGNNSGNNSGNDPRNAPDNAPYSDNAPNNSSDAGNSPSNGLSNGNGTQDMAGGNNNSAGNSPASEHNPPISNPTRKPVVRRSAVKKTPTSDAGDPFNGDMPSFLSVDDK